MVALATNRLDSGTAEFEDYRAETPNPFMILERGNQAPTLCQLLVSLPNREPHLFHDSAELERMLAEMRALQEAGTPLYQRFRKEVAGKERDFSVPKSLLREFFDQYLIPLVNTEEAHPIAHGGQPLWSPSLSLQRHLPMGSVLSFDLSAAYENIKPEYIFGFFRRVLGNFDLDPLQGRDLAGFLAMMSTVRYASGKRGLPQGSPHSTPLFNRVLSPLDESLANSARDRGMTATRWIDDITLSSPASLKEGEFLGAINIYETFLPVSERKVFFQKSHSPIFLLGHRIEAGQQISHNTKEEREKLKVKPLDYATLRGSGQYNPW